MKNLSTFLSLQIIAIVLVTNISQAQVHFSVNPTLDTARISPLIYGSNGFTDDPTANISIRRLGGNRLTGYNWETNASHAGVDYLNQNDDFMTWANGITGKAADSAGIVVRRFHEKSISTGAQSLITIQAAGYVAADKSGDSVTLNESAPSLRFHPIEFNKPTPLSLIPDKNDNTVYMDEQVNYYKSLFGSAADSGIRAYAIDNEPGLWHYSHPRIRKEEIPISDILKRTVDLATSIKRVDESALVVGGTCYGFGEFIDFQDAPDKNTALLGYDSYISAFLDHTKKASDANGKQLVDVLDLHWYPEATGKTNDGTDGRVCQSNFADNTDDGIVQARIQAPRSLWDSTYKEKSWITQYIEINKPYISLIPKMMKRIQQYNPAMKLGICETDYGGSSHISGGLAIADVLGIYGKYGVFMSMYWGDIKEFTAGGYKLFRNFDGQNGRFPDVRCFSHTEDAENTSIYSAIDPATNNLHLILLNKNLKQTTSAEVQITDTRDFTIDAIYSLEMQQAAILKKDKNTATITGKTLTMNLPMLSATHVVLKPKPANSTDETNNRITFEMYPNPATDYATFNYALSDSENATIEIFDLFGREMMKQSLTTSAGNILIKLGAIPAGIYQVQLHSHGNRQVGRLVVVR
jgi:mannan endo-1,4-beta-mannosidase